MKRVFVQGEIDSHTPANQHIYFDALSAYRGSDAHGAHPEIYLSIAKVTSKKGVHFGSELGLVSGPCLTYRRSKKLKSFPLRGIFTAFGLY